MRGGVDNVGYDTESNGEISMMKKLLGKYMHEQSNLGSVPHVYSVTGNGLSSASNSDSEASPPASPEHRAEADRKGDILGLAFSLFFPSTISTNDLYFMTMLFQTP